MTAPNTPAAPDPVRAGSRVRHKKRGTVYEVIAPARLQTDAPLGDMTELVLYRAEDGSYWARSPDEFFDGRFEALAPQVAGGGELEAAWIIHDEETRCRSVTLDRIDAEAAERNGYSVTRLYERSAKAALGAGVKVKPLVWVEGVVVNTDDDNGPLEGIPHDLLAWFSGPYTIIRQRGVDGRYILKGKRDGIGLVVPHLDAAKAAAQADYDLSALTPEPPAEANTVHEVKPHRYSPDYQAMGDCKVCGHDYDSPLHAHPPADTPAPGEAELVERASDPDFVGSLQGFASFCETHAKTGGCGPYDLEMLAGKFRDAAFVVDQLTKLRDGKIACGMTLAPADRIAALQAGIAAKDAENAALREALAALYDAYETQMKSEYDFPGNPWTPERDHNTAAIAARAALSPHRAEGGREDGK